MESLVARLTQPPPIPDELSAAWRQLLSAMTTIEPGGRPSADDVAAEARRIAANPDAEPATGATLAMPAMAGLSTPDLPTMPDLPTVASASPGGDGAPSVAARSPRTRRIALISAIAVVVLAAAVAVPLLSSGGAAPAPSPSFPALPDPINTHIDDLWNEVSP